MAKIIQKSSKRNRVQFTLNATLYNNYKRCMDLAEELKATVDFSSDFERWLTNQLEQVNRDLERLKEESPKQIIIPETNTQMLVTTTPAQEHITVLQSIISARMDNNGDY